MVNRLWRKINNQVMIRMGAVEKKKKKREKEEAEIDVVFGWSRRD